jgi:hypothetical protein
MQASAAFRRMLRVLRLLHDHRAVSPENFVINGRPFALARDSPEFFR